MGRKYLFYPQKSLYYLIVIPATFPTVLFQVSVQFLSTLLHVFFQVGKTTFKAASFTLAVSASLNVTLFKLYLVCFSQGVDEYGGYVVAILVAFGISQNVLLRGHIRIDFFL